MDYKTNSLTKDIEVSEALLPEVAGLLFGTLSEDQAVFDYTAYFDNNKLEYIDHKVFMRTNKMYIETLAKGRNRKTSELFFQNANGHILVSSELTFLFLFFANPEMCLYFNNLIGDVLSTGVAYSDGLIYSLAIQRLPDDMLKNIINLRKANETGNQQ